GVVRKRDGCITQRGRCSTSAIEACGSVEMNKIHEGEGGYNMQTCRRRKSLGLVAAAAAAVLAVGLASAARAQDCNGALNITVPFSPKAVPPTGPYLNVGDS